MYLSISSIGWQFVHRLVLNVLIFQKSISHNAIDCLVSTIKSGRPKSIRTTSDFSICTIFFRCVCLFVWFIAVFKMLQIYQYRQCFSSDWLFFTLYSCAQLRLVCKLVYSGTHTIYQTNLKLNTNEMCKATCSGIQVHKWASDMFPV